jgi:hypothetical protein
MNLQIGNVGLDESCLPQLLSALKNNDALMHLNISDNTLTQSQENTIMVCAG